MPTKIGSVQSFKNPKVFYDIFKGRDGVTYCACDGWKWQKVAPKDRDCKHLAAFRKGLNHPSVYIPAVDQKFIQGAVVPLPKPTPPSPPLFSFLKFAGTLQLLHDLANPRPTFLEID